MFMQIVDDLKIVVSDTTHTKGSKSFWKKLCEKYINSPFFEVGYYDQYLRKYIKFAKNKEDFDDEFEEQYNPETEYNNFYIKDLS
jgi:hypothetical protein